VLSSMLNFNDHIKVTCSTTKVKLYMIVYSPIWNMESHVWWYSKKSNIFAKLSMFVKCRIFVLIISSFKMYHHYTVNPKTEKRLKLLNRVQLCFPCRRHATPSLMRQAYFQEIRFLFSLLFKISLKLKLFVVIYLSRCCHDS
jgi:hypothetical protein